MTDGVLAQVAFDSSMEVLEKAIKKHPPKVLFKTTNLLVLPALVAASILILFATLVLPRLLRFLNRRVIEPLRDSFAPYQSLPDDDEDIEDVPPPPTPLYAESHGLMADLKAHIRSLREYGTVLFALEVLRTLCLATLLGLSIYAAVQAEVPAESSSLTYDGDDFGDNSGLFEILKKKKKHGGKKHKTHDRLILGEYSNRELGEFAACMFYAYTLMASCLLLALRPATPLRRQVIAHLDTLLLLGWGLYAYRDLWPLLTYHLRPTDLQNAITWSRVAILTAAAVIIPLVRPRTYVPADPENPSPPDQIAPEQTSPWLFFVFYEYMTDLVWKAWRSPSLDYEELHPLADSDGAALLYRKHIYQLDPYLRKKAGLRPRSLFVGLLATFKFEAFLISLMSLLSGAFQMSGSVAINQLLSYLETDGQGAQVRPIVWVALLVLGPLATSLAIQFYIYLNTRNLVRAESLLTQLLFDHALRLRMKDSIDESETSDSPPVAGLPIINIDQIGLHPPAPAEEVLIDLVDGQGNSTEGAVVEQSDDTSKGKEFDKGSNKESRTEKDAEQGHGQGIAGKINVLMAADVDSIVNGRDFPLILFNAPIQFILCVFLLYRILSWSSLIGIITLMATLPLPGLLTKINADIQQRRMLATDARVDSITEAVNSLRMLKMFAWEDKMKYRISVKREAELKLIWHRRLVTLCTLLLNIILPVITMTITFAFYTIVQGQQLTASKVFTSMTVFELFNSQMGMCFYLMNEVVTAYVSLKRIDKFLNESEMIDEYEQGEKMVIKSQGQLEAEEQDLIRIHNATFAWGSSSGENTPGFSLRIPDLTFVKDRINLVTGPTGSGKSSLIKALIGELHFIPGDGGFYHLPRSGGVSYAAQESWCMNETIKDNILFGEPYDELRYRRVLRDCALEADLKMFDDGDETEIGEKGITLSGGQKARVTLARAVYSPSKVVLLDDIFSALDTLTSRWIIDHLFRGELMENRTVLLITHHVALAAPMADFLVRFHSDGSIHSAGPIGAEPLEDDEEEVPAVTEEKKESGRTEPPTPAESKPEVKKPGSKLVQAEEKNEGRISRKALFSFFSTFGGPVFWILYFMLLFSGEAMSAFQTYWLGRWARAYETVHDPKDVSITFWLGLYFVWVLIGLAGVASASILFYYGANNGSREIHHKLVEHIFGAYMRFLDATPVGRIISRFTKDMKAVDGSFTDGFADVAIITISLLIKLVAVVSLVPLSSIPVVIIGVIGGILGELYIHGQLSVKREMSNAKSPLFSHFSAAVNGIVSIRAYGAQQKLRAEARKRTDKYTRTARAFYNLNRWVTVRIDLLGGLFAAGLAAFLVYGSRKDASTSGFALSQAISFSAMILWWVRMVNEMEVQGNSVERIEDYLVIDQEPANVDSKQPPASWPTSGEIILDKLSAQYSIDGPIVLDNLEVRIASGEKVGIVGRTGSGKSTLALALLRMLPTTGDVIIGGKKAKDINLKALRSQITIIPQDPILLSGSLRFNLDPFGDSDDATLNDALQASGLGQARHAESGTATPQRLTLDYQISAGGGNLSQGQRQLVALARALVRSSKILILDEATASVDFETDALIQKSIRDLPESCTVLTVAHRLSTVMDYDKILVLGAGKVLEFDTPENLKRDPSSYFAQLVKAMEG